MVHQVQQKRMIILNYRKLFVGSSVSLSEKEDRLVHIWQTWFSHKVPSAQHHRFKWVNKQLSVYPATMTHIRFLAYCKTSVCGMADEMKSIWEREEEEDNGGSVRQNTKADIKAKQETLVLTQPTTFAARQEQEFACMLDINLQNNHDLSWSVQWVVLIFTELKVSKNINNDTKCIINSSCK